MFFWHVPAPNEALLISGSKHQSQETQFRIVTGHGCFVLPINEVLVGLVGQGMSILDTLKKSSTAANVGPPGAVGPAPAPAPAPAAVADVAAAAR